MPHNGHLGKENRQKSLQKKNLHFVTLITILSNSTEVFRVPFDLHEESKKSKIDEC